ncbi:hypothetical protein COCOBI_09-5610 [Coccomyxa sp. Obi]|nr:hypothetical protein COCOBI_09-5610 [Coccomyxa sp. Obi]
MGACKSFAAILVTTLALSVFYQAQAIVNTTAAAEVVRLAVADPTVLAAANDLITAAKTSVLTGGLTTFDVTALLANPQVQAAAVPLIETASAAAGPAWLAVLPQATAVAKNSTAASQVLKMALADPAVLTAAKSLVSAVQMAAIANPLTGYSVSALAANPGVQAALVPLVAAAANASGVQWAAVDSSAVVAAATTAATTVTPLAPSVAAYQAQPSLLPNLQSLFGRKMQQVILNPGDFLGLPTDPTKGTPSAADAARLNAALGLTGAQTAQDTAFQQEQAAVQRNTRMSDSATTNAAMQSFDVSSLNPTGNNIRATQQYQQRAAPAGAGAGTAAAPTTAPAAYGFAAAPYDPTAAPQKVAIMASDGSYHIQAAAPTAGYSTYDTASSNLAAADVATPADATQSVGQVNIKPANQVAPSQISQGSVLQRPGASDATTATTTDTAGSSTAAQDILSSLSGGLADSPGVSPAPQGQAFDWLQPSPTAPQQVPADSIVAQREASGGAAARPPASQDSQNVRTFVSQAGFSPGKGVASSTATSGAAATQQQGRRLAEAQRMSASGGAQPAMEDAQSLALRVAQAFGQAATALLANAPALSPSSDVLLVGPALEPATPPTASQTAAVTPAAGAKAPAPAPATSMSAEVAAAASLAAPNQASALEPPKPPLHELVDAAAELPARLRILPPLPGMPGTGQPEPASTTAAAQLQNVQTMFTLPGNQGTGAVEPQRSGASAGKRLQ